MLMTMMTERTTGASMSACFFAKICMKNVSLMAIAATLMPSGHQDCSSGPAQAESKCEVFRSSGVADPYLQIKKAYFWRKMDSVRRV